MTGDQPTFDIGEVVRLSGIPPSTLHVWERRGLVQPSGRKGLRRQYGGDVLERIASIVLFQRGGFTLAEIASLLGPDAFEAGKEQFTAKLDELRRIQTELATAITGLEHAISCSEPSPLECPHFRSMLGDVLPVRRRPSSGTEPAARSTLGLRPRSTGNR